jgi:protein MAK11
MATVTLKRKLEVTQPKTSNKKRNINGKVKDLGDAEPHPQLQTQPEPQLERTKNQLVTTAEAEDVTIQIVAGSYDRVLHGIIATASSQHFQEQNLRPNDQNGADSKPDVTFTDNFLFAAHTSSIRCLALSPPTESNKRLLATGSSDERINLYSLSTSAPPSNFKPQSSLLPRTSSTSSNRPLGSLTHHSRPVTSCSFPSKSKLFTAAEDNTVAITRTRDWTLLDSIKAPIPKPSGRPSGDTLAPGEVPAGVNDFAIHPSQKLMLSVGRGERCMRLWNLMTGKKAGVLQFSKEVLEAAGEGKYSRGEGRVVRWFGNGEGFVLGFERGLVVYGVDCKVRGVVRPQPGTKIHQVRFVPIEGKEVLGVSMEDGRVQFYDLSDLEDDANVETLPNVQPIGQLGGRAAVDKAADDKAADDKAAKVTNRIKDFEVLVLPPTSDQPTPPLLVVTGHSDGVIRMWTLWRHEIMDSSSQPSTNGDGEKAEPKQVGNLIGTVETDKRITCLGAFVMDGPAHGAANTTKAEEEIDEISGSDDESDSVDGEEDDFEGFDD